MTISIWKKLNFYILLSQKNDNCSTVSSSCHFFCHLLESGLARINWIRANYKICVEQLICCQKCRANACRAIAIRAVHPHSDNLLDVFLWISFLSFHPISFWKVYLGLFIWKKSNYFFPWYLIHPLLISLYKNV